MTLRLALKIDGDPAGARAAIQKLRTDISKVNEDLKKSQTLGAQFDQAFNIANDNQMGDRAGDIEAYGRELDALRAKHNPLFAAQQRYKAELDGIRKAHRLGAISADEMNAALARSKSSFAGQVARINNTTGALQLNQQQLLNMQFQMNDMAVMLASGQSPFVLFMQQGMQIGQMFGPGSTVQQALKATGAGLISFVTNPINLAIAGTAVLAGAVPLIFSAFTGPEAKSAKDVMEEFDEFIAGLGEGYKDAGEAADIYLEKVQSAAVVEVKARQQVRELSEAQKIGMDELIARTQAFILPWDQINPKVLTTTGEIRSLGVALKEGSISADQFVETLAEIYLAENTPDIVREIVTGLLDGSDAAEELEQRIKGGNAALDVMSGKANEVAGRLREALTPTLGLRIGSETYADLEAELKAQADKLQREKDRLGREGEREAHRSARAASRLADQHAQNALLIGDLEKEVLALSATGDERERLITSLKEEQEIRQAIQSLGSVATQDEINRLQVLIPARNRALEASRLQEEQLRREEQMAGRFASTLAGVTVQLAKGANAGEVFGSMLQNIGQRLLEQGLQQLFMAILGGGMGGGGNPFMSLLFSAQGNAFANGRVTAFANGGVVNSPTLFPMRSGAGVMGEAGPEAIMPLKRTASGRLGVEVADSSSTIRIALGPGLEASMLSRARGQSIQIVREAAPSISAEGARGGKQLAQDSYARSHWGKF